jgi:hypothetical protein
MRALPILLSLTFALSIGCNNDIPKDPLGHDPYASASADDTSEPIDPVIDNDDDGVAEADDCDDDDATLGATADDEDCDGAVTVVDCDDTTADLGSIWEDGDCDAALTADDCDDADMLLGGIAADVDCDGALTDADCDDADSSLGSIATDGDCDGTLIADDCDDSTPDTCGDWSGWADSFGDGCDYYEGAPGDCAIAADWADDDGVDAGSACCVCGGGSPPLTRTEDADCDAVATADDCDDGDASIYPGATEILDDDIDQDCNDYDAITCEGDYHYADAEHCAIITGSLTISGTDEEGAEDFALLHTLEEVGGALYIDGNAALTSLSFDSLTDVGGDIVIYDNAALTSLSFDSLTTVGGKLNIILNGALTSLSFDSLTDIGGDLYIEDNAALTSVSFDSLTTVGAELYFAFNHALPSVSFDSLTDIGGSLYMSSNASLMWFSVDSLTDIGGWGIWIRYNTALCQSLVDAFVDAMTALGWYGPTNIEENDDTC